MAAPAKKADHKAAEPPQVPAAAGAAPQIESKAAKPKRATRGPAEPLSVAQYAALLAYLQWRHPRPPVRRDDGAHAPAEILDQLASVFRSAANFRSTYGFVLSMALLTERSGFTENVRDDFEIVLGPTKDEDRILRKVPTDVDPLRTLAVMPPADVVEWVRRNHRDGPRCEFSDEFSLLSAASHIKPPPFRVLCQVSR